MRAKIFLLALLLIIPGAFLACAPQVDVEELETARNEAEVLGEKMAVGDIAVVGLCDDGTVIGSDAVDAAIGEWIDIVDISAISGDCVGVRRDGAVEQTPHESKYYSFDTSSWGDIVSALDTGGTIVGLKNDGTVVATGNNESGQCDVSEWAGIDAIYGNYANTVGIKKDGTALLAGYSAEEFGEAVAEWEDVVDIEVGPAGIAGLQADRVVVYQGPYAGEGARHYFKTTDWDDVVAISMGQNHLVGLKSDGTVMATGDNFKGQCEVKEWKNVVAIKATRDFTIGLDIEGNILITHKSVKDYKTYNASAEERAVAINANENNIFYLTDEGRIVSIGNGFNYKNLPDLRPLW